MLDWIKKPTLLLDEAICRKNIKAMAEKAKRQNLIFRPHFKTHQSVEIGEWFREYGVSKITVSSVSMAIKFLQAGWQDITIAFPLNIREYSKIVEISTQCRLNLLITDIESIRYLQKKCSNEIGFFIKIDVGNHRVGLAPEETQLIDTILTIAKPNQYLAFKGFLAHAGHTYHAKNKEEIHAIHQNSCYNLKQLKETYQSVYPDIICSYGDTPSCSIMNHFPGIDEIRPGNFVFYDEMQYQIGSCSQEEIALIVACPVVSKNSSRNEIIIYGGGVHLSKEYIYSNGAPVYGKAVELTSRGWQFPATDLWITSLSQEHGKLSVSSNRMSTFEIGDLLGIIPIHSCLTANLFDCYYTLAKKSNKILK